MFIEDCVFHPTVENYVMIIAFCTIFCLSVVGNSIVVVVLLQQKSMRTITNLYLLNLALSDLLLSVVCMPPTLVSSLVYCWVFGDLLCKLLAYLQPVVVTASAYTLAAIALERYYAICKPLHSRVWHTRSHAFCVIGVVWLISIIANFFMLFMYELRTYNRTGLNCATKYEPAVHFAYQIYMTVVLLVIPLVLMTMLYGAVIRSLRTGLKMDIAAIEVAENPAERVEPPRSATNKRSLSLISGRSRRTRIPLISVRGEEQNGGVSSRKGSEFIEQSLRSTHSGRTAVAKQRLIRMLIVIVIIFFCCWTPSYIWWLLLNAQDAYGTFNVWNSGLNTFITVLTYLSSCTNPITYCFLNSKFRNAMFMSFGCKHRSLRTRFQRIYTPGHSNPTQVYRNSQCPQSTNVSFREPDSNSNESQPKQMSRSISLTYNVLNRLRGVLNKKESEEGSLTRGRRTRGSECFPAMNANNNNRCTPEIIIRASGSDPLLGNNNGLPQSASCNTLQVESARKQESCC